MNEAAPENAATSVLLAPPNPWPPLILPAKATWWMRARDLLLTVFGWVLYLWILREPLASLVVWLAPSTKDSLEHLSDERHVNLQPFLWIAGTLVVWLCVKGLMQRQRLRQQPGADQRVPALAPETHFEKFGVPIAQISQWRESRILRVQFNAGGRITNATS